MRKWPATVQAGGTDVDPDPAGQPGPADPGPGSGLGVGAAAAASATACCIWQSTQEGWCGAEAALAKDEAEAEAEAGQGPHGDGGCSACASSLHLQRGGGEARGVKAGKGLVQGFN